MRTRLRRCRWGELCYKIFWETFFLWKAEDSSNTFQGSLCTLLQLLSNFPPRKALEANISPHRHQQARKILQNLLTQARPVYCGAKRRREEKYHKAPRTQNPRGFNEPKVISFHISNHIFKAAKTFHTIAIISMLFRCSHVLLTQIRSRRSLSVVS